MISDTNEKAEPAPLTQREMNQFITLAALPTLERALDRLRWLEAQRASLTNPTTIMVRIDEGWITPSDAVREITRLRAEVATLKACDPLNDAVEEACGELPDGWQVIINMERGAGWVDLFDPDGDCIEVQEDETSVSDLVREAVRRAKGGQP